jgi:hypothetical protein
MSEYIKDSQHLARLIERLAEVSPNQILSNSSISNEILTIAGDWCWIGYPEGRHYIDALNLDNNGQLLKQVIRAYVMLRRNSLQHLKENRSNYDFSIDDGYFILNQLIENCKDNAIFALSEIREMLHSDDCEIERTGCSAIQWIGEEAIQLLPDLFSLMEKRGINERPYKIGELLVQLSQSSPKVLDGIKLNLSSTSENLLTSNLFTCSLMGNKSNLFYADLKRLAESPIAQVKSLAILALGSTENQSDEIGSILLENTNSPEWYIRGNAITSLGRLKLLPEKAVPIIINALDDNEGHDWTVRGSAIEALGYYADSSIIDKQSIISALETFRKKLKDEQDDDWIFQIKEVNKTLKKLKSYHNGNRM